MPKYDFSFDDSSTSRPPLYSQSEQTNGSFLNDRNRNSNRNIILLNDHDVGEVLSSAQLFPIDAANNENEELPTVSVSSLCQFKPVQNNTKVNGPNARLALFTSEQNKSREDVSNISDVHFRPLPQVQNMTLENSSSTISDDFEFNAIQHSPEIVTYNVTSANIFKFKSNNPLTEASTAIPAAQLQSPSKQCNYNEHRRNISSSGGPVLNLAINCNTIATSENLLQFQPMQNIDKDPKIKPAVPVLLDSILRTTKEDMDHDDSTLGIFDLSPVHEDGVEDSRSGCRLNLLKPLELNRSINPDKSCIEPCRLKISTFELPAPIDGNKVCQMKKSNVLWENMFDTELLPNDVIAPAIKEKIIDEQTTTVNHKQFKISFPKANTKNKKTNKKEEGNESKPVKRKREKTSNIEKCSKKLKEDNLNTKKKIVRKEKYTKTVKKWLDGVVPNNPVENDNIQESKDSNRPDERGRETDSKTLEQEISEDQKAVLPKKQKEAKKIVQARLANKGGVMKFDKPVQQESGQHPDPDPSSDTTTAETASKAPNRVSLKKGKPKFVAPLKSQIPVKEIEYNVVVVDENNSEEHLTKLEKLNTIEVYAVLTYSNGFCQLNEQFTEDDCVPDGVMLLIEEEFYYFQKSAEAFSDVILKFLQKQTVVCYDGKNILIFFQTHFAMDINFCMHDLQIGGSLLEPDSPPDSFGDVQKLAGSAPQYSVATTCPRQKTAWYLTLLRDCADKMKAKLREHSLWSLFEDIEMPVLPIIAEMEFLGILVDTEKLQRMEAVLLSRMQATERQCWAAAGRALSLGSPAQVSAVLYDQLQLHTRANLHVRETLAKGNKSTSEDMLRMLVPLHPLPGLILEYRRLHKAHATFLAGIRQHVKDGVLKPTWVQTAAATGRVASNNPNVQSIPKVPFSLSSDAENPEEALNLRSVYLARPGHVLLAADFRQIECRVFASAAADDVLLAALRCGRDLFTVLAAQWLKKPEEDVSAADRERTKRIVYASLYGAGLNKLMTILDVSRDQAAAVSASFHRAFPSLKRFEQRVQQACASGHAPRTPAGRARPLPALGSEHAAERARANRQALNFLVQGTAADVCKLAMARAHSALRDAGLNARLLLQIHDELVWELPEPQLPQAHAVVCAAMAGSGRGAGLLTPLPVAASAGRSWGELRDLPDPTPTPCLTCPPPSPCLPDPPPTPCLPDPHCLDL